MLSFELVKQHFDELTAGRSPERLLRSMMARAVPGFFPPLGDEYAGASIRAFPRD